MAKLLSICMSLAYTIDPIDTRLYMAQTMALPVHHALTSRHPKLRRREGCENAHDPAACAFRLSAGCGACSYVGPDLSRRRSIA
jgi:hypothetical protein